MPNQVESFEHLKKIREACLSNAEDLVNSAKSLIENGAFQVCYHLAALALEEIGKLGLMEVKYNLGRFSEDREYNPDIEDHTKKLFWAFFGMHLAGHKIDPTEYNFLKGLASQIHKKRLESLYVDVANPTAPRSRLSREDVEIVIGLAENRLGFEKSQTFKEPNAALDEIGKWFVFAQEDPEKRSFIFTEESYAKLTELQSFRKWIEWNKNRYEEQKAALKQILDQELLKQASPTDEELAIKWKVFVTFASDSHTIRNSFISEWNKHASHIFVAKSKKNNELLCQFLLPRKVHVEDIFAKGWITAKIMAVSMNIATFGFFWWYVPSSNYFYADRILNLESETLWKFQTPANLNIHWEPRTLKAEDVLNIKLVMSYLVKIRNQKEEAPLDSYLIGLMLFSKSDAHLQFETNAFERFFTVLQSAMLINGDWKEGEELYDAVIRYLGDAITDQVALKRHLQIGQEIEGTQTGRHDIQMNDVAEMKSYCDAYLLLRAATVVADAFYNKTNQ
jgi:AbiV family abortive infection protein